MGDPIGLSAIAEYLPERRVTNPELIGKFGFEADFLDRKIGIAERRIAGAGESVSDMAVAAAQALFESHAARPDEIELLVLCTQNPDYKLPTTANLVQHRLGLRQSIAAFDINQGCSGFVYGLATMQGFMAQHGMQRGLLITSEAYSKVMDPDDRATVPLFGDGAAACLVQPGGAGRIGQFVFGSDGSGAEDLIVKGGGSRNPDMPVEGPGALYMNGRAIYTFMMRRIPQCIRDCVARNGLSLEDVDLFVFHQASRYMIESLSGAMKLDPKKVIIEMDQTGNTVSSTIPMALRRADATVGLAGKRVLVCGFGVGLSWAATLLDYRLIAK